MSLHQLQDLNVSREDLFSEDYISCQDTLVIMETDKPVEGNIVTTVHLDSSKNVTACLLLFHLHSLKTDALSLSLIFRNKENRLKLLI